MSTDKNSEDKFRQILSKEKAKRENKSGSSNTAFFMMLFIDGLFTTGRITISYFGYSALTKYVELPAINYFDFFLISAGIITIAQYIKKLFKG